MSPVAHKSCSQRGKKTQSELDEAAIISRLKYIRPLQGHRACRQTVPYNVAIYART